MKQFENPEFNILIFDVVDQITTSSLPTTGDGCDDDYETDWKPVIYLYPEKEQTVSVKLELTGGFKCTYPTYDDGWRVVAKPDGTLTDEKGRNYYCLFWEGLDPCEYDLTKGFVVKGTDTAEFLEKTLAILGLNEKEANEFIIFWLPRMEENPYNLITFQTTDYEKNAKLTVEPKPDSVLRVFMAYKPLQESVCVEPQKLEPFNRHGFAVIEWGGTEVNK